jgi:hypothetical protein
MLCGKRDRDSLMAFFMLSHSYSAHLHLSKFSLSFLNGRRSSPSFFFSSSSLSSSSSVHVHTLPTPRRVPARGIYIVRVITTPDGMRLRQSQPRVVAQPRCSGTSCMRKQQILRNWAFITS